MMKINEKNLCSFASSSTPIDKEGYLYKKGDINRGYQRRYFVLKGNLLFYYEKQGDKEPLGVIMLEGYTIELEEDEDFCSFKIQFQGDNSRSYVLAAESHESMEKWMKALACASYDYIKLMVSELQRQLDELNDPSSAEEALPNSSTGAGASPVPPPRNRSLRGTKPAEAPQKPSSLWYKAGNRPASGPSSPRVSISFWELHSTYGRPILADYQRWQQEELKRSEPRRDQAEANLIEL